MALSSCGFSVESRGLSAEQQAKVQSFKRLLQQSGAWDDGCFDEHDCARFLKARNYDLPAAKQMWDSMLAWRRENRVNTIRDWFVFKERREYDRVFPTGLHKTDKEGHPVLIQQLGRVNISALYKVTTDERIRLAHIAENEHLRRVVFPACSRAARRPIDQLFTIIDLDGVAFTSMMRTTSLLKMFMAMDSNNYPETLAHMAIINAPGWFSTSWSAVKSVLSGDTVRKIEILGKDYQAALLKHIPRANLLMEYGGLSRGCVTDNEGPWQEELLPEAPAPPPPEALVPLPQPLLPMPATAAAGAISEGGELPGSGGEAAAGDQLTQRDVLTRQAPSPVRPGAKAAAGIPVATPGAGGHQAPPVSPPVAKRPHVEEVQLQPQQVSARSGPPQGLQPQVGPGSSSPAHSISDSDSAQSMAAPLMSNFLSSSESPSPQHHTHHHQQLVLTHHRQQQTPPLARVSPQQLSAGGAQAAAAGTPQLAMQRRSSGGGTGGLVAGLVASLHAAVGHVGTHHHQPQPGASASAADGGVLRPPTGLPPSLAVVAGPQTPLQNSHPLPQQQPQLPQQPVVAARGGAAGPAQLLLSSPREDATGPGTMLSAVSAVYSPLSLMSPLSPVDLHSVADTATSRRTDGGGSGSLGPPHSGPTVQVGPVATAGGGPMERRSGGANVSTGGGPMERRSGGANVSTGGGPMAVVSSAGISSFAAQAAAPAGMAAPFTVDSGVSVFSSAILASGDLLPVAASGAAAAAASGPLPLLHQQQQTNANDADDAESVRASVMSQRSFYSALSHLDQSSSSSLTSPAEAAENARRWSMQRELHAAAIAAALAATAERKAAAAAATAAAGGGAGGGLAKTSATHPAATVGIPPAGALSGVSYIVPPAAQQAFGSYLDQPPPYGALRAADGSGSLTNADGPATVSGLDEGEDVSSGSAAHGSAVTAGGSGQRSLGVVQTVDAVAIQVGSDSNGGGSAATGGGMSRSPSMAAMSEDCSLGAGAVRWARGWFFRRRNYGRLVESDGAADGMSLGNPGGGSMMVGRGKGGAAQYTSMQAGPCATSPSKIVPKMPAGAHHARGDSWEWDQPSPYDIDQTYGRAGAGGGVGGSMMHREASFGRGAERRRLLRSESPGRRRRMEDYCGCLPCCTIM